MKTKPDILISLTALVLFLFVMPTYAQESREESASFDRYRAVFDDVQSGISSGDITSFVQHFASKVVVNLRDTESGTFSSNQAYYVLRGFFRSRQFDQFEFSTIDGSDFNPYASGSVKSTVKGNRETVQVYVALSFNRGKYVITQLTIY